MKYLVHVTAPIISRVDADNLRGEPRWERSVFAAALATGRPVHSTLPIWRSNLSKPDNFHDDINEAWLQESVLITHGVAKNPHITARASKYIVQYHESPTGENKHLFLDYHDRDPGSIVATTSTKNLWTWNRLQTVLGADKVEWVEGPNIASVVDEADNFRKPYFLWSYRNFTRLAAEAADQMEELFARLRFYLANDPAARIGIIVGAWDPGVLGQHPSREALRDWAFSLPCMKVLVSIQDRVDMFIQLDYHRVLDILAETRMIISPAEPAGLPPYEAGRYGIPTILASDANPLQDFDNKPFFPELLMAPSRAIAGPFLSHIDRLQNDHAFYRKHGDAYRTYIKGHATYQAYTDRLQELMTRRGWL